MNQNIYKTEKFLKAKFQKYPDFSYDDWRVMYEHSVDVKNIAIKIAKKVKGDVELAALAALLHDIGKAYKASKQYLEKYSHRLNAIVSSPLFRQLTLSPKDKNKLKSILSYKGSSKELKIMMDADAIAFLKDSRLHSLYFKWALQKKKYEDLKRHVKKYENLNFDISRKLAKPWYTKMMRTWKPRIQKIIDN